MELADTWTCGCGAVNTSDVLTGDCWKCQSPWGDGIVKIETAESLQMCPDCRATNGFHKIDCPTHPLPKE